MGGGKASFRDGWSAHSFQTLRTERNDVRGFMLRVRFLARPHALTDGNLTAVGDVRTQPIWMRTTGRHKSVRDGGGEGGGRLELIGLTAAADI